MLFRSLPVSISEPVNISKDVLAAGAGIVHKDTTIDTTTALRKWLTMSSTEQTEMCKQAQQLYSDSFAFSSVTGRLVHAITTE